MEETASDQRVYVYFVDIHTESGHAVVQLVDALHYKPEGSGFDSRWRHWNLS